MANNSIIYNGNNIQKDVYATYFSNNKVIGENIYFDIYVNSSTGNDNNDGSAGQPKATIPGALSVVPAHIQKTVRILLSGSFNISAYNVIPSCFGQFPTEIFASDPTAPTTNILVYGQGATIYDTVVDGGGTTPFILKTPGLNILFERIYFQNCDSAVLALEGTAALYHCLYNGFNYALRAEQHGAVQAYGDDPAMSFGDDGVGPTAIFAQNGGRADIIGGKFYTYNPTVGPFVHAGPGGLIDINVSSFFVEGDMSSGGGTGTRYGILVDTGGQVNFKADSAKFWDIKMDSLARAIKVKTGGKFYVTGDTAFEFRNNKGNIDVETGGTFSEAVGSTVTYDNHANPTLHFHTDDPISTPIFVVDNRVRVKFNGTTIPSFPQEEFITFQDVFVPGDTISGTVTVGSTPYSYSVPYNTSSAITLNMVMSAMAALNGGNIFNVSKCSNDNTLHTITMIGKPNVDYTIDPISVTGTPQTATITDVTGVLFDTDIATTTSNIISSLETFSGISSASIITNTDNDLIIEIFPSDNISPFALTMPLITGGSSTSTFTIGEQDSNLRDVWLYAGANALSQTNFGWITPFYNGVSPSGFLGNDYRYGQLSGANSWSGAQDFRATSSQFGGSITSGATITPNMQGNSYWVTGTNIIEGVDTTNMSVGYQFTLVFDDAATIKHDYGTDTHFLLAGSTDALCETNCSFIFEVIDITGTKYVKELSRTFPTGTGSPGAPTVSPGIQVFESAEIDCKVSGGTDIVAVPTGKSFRVIAVVVYPTLIDTVSIVPIVNFGSNSSPTYSTWKTTNTLTGTFGINQYITTTQFYPVSAGDSFGVYISTPATGTTYNAKFQILGYFVDA